MSEKKHIWHKVLENRNELGKISKEQRTGGFDVFATGLHNTGFAAFAESCGALGLHAGNKNELEDKMKQTLHHKGTALLEIKTDVNLI